LFDKPNTKGLLHEGAKTGISAIIKGGGCQARKVYGFGDKRFIQVQAFL
jgi:hypothetical protein